MYGVVEVEVPSIYYVITSCDRQLPKGNFKHGGEVKSCGCWRMDRTVFL